MTSTGSYWVGREAVTVAWRTVERTTVVHAFTSHTARRSPRGVEMIKVLLVEDDAEMLDLTAYVLRRERFVVIEASDGATALRRWKADRPDLVVLDLGLPAVDGFEVLRRVREDDEATPILVLTARRDAQDILRCFNLGTDDFLPKPFEFRELTARMRAILRRARVSGEADSEARPKNGGPSLDPPADEVILRGKRGRPPPPQLPLP